MKNRWNLKSKSHNSEVVNLPSDKKKKKKKKEEEKKQKKVIIIKIKKIKKCIENLEKKLSWRSRRNIK